MNELTITDLLESIKSYNDNESDIARIKRAYYYAETLHKNQFRQSGEPYISHPLNVAYILSKMHADAETICAGLLHDTLEDTDITKEIIAKDFSREIAILVDGVTKISRLEFSSKNEQNMANIRKIITGIISDVRIIVIKLADRLHNMRTLQYKTEIKQKENSAETINLFVPLAYYIGAYQIKSELEDLSLQYLDLDQYKKIEEIKLKIEEDSSKCLHDMLFQINKILSDNSISSEIKVRTKNIYGIYKKLNTGHKISDIHDLLALKIMVDDVTSCYQTLGLVHEKYHPINNKFKDYICNPKTNMYKSLHTTVFGPDDRLVQTQIRTFEMEKVASLGITAYWDIKKGNARDVMQQELKEKFQFFKALLEIDKTSTTNQEFVNQIKNELLSDRVYAYTPKGDILELPKGATAIDFAYQLNSKLGNTMVSALVNDKQVNPEYILNNKDRVKVITDLMSYGPRKEWLNQVKTSKAKRKIIEINNRSQ